MNSSWPLWIIGIYWLWSLLGKERQRVTSRWFWIIVIVCGIVGVGLLGITGHPMPVVPEERPPGY